MEEIINENIISFIPSNSIEKINGKFTYISSLIDLIPINPHKISIKSVLVEYLKYSNSTLELRDFTVMNLLGITSINNNIYFVQEKIEVKPISTQLKNYNNYTKLKIVKEICEIVSYFHNKLKTPLRILSTANIYLINGQVKLKVININRVCAECCLENNKSKESFYNYLPPDIFDEISVNEEDNSITNYTYKGNIWSVGCLISEIFSGFIPWTNSYKNNEAVIMKLLITKINFPVPNSISKINQEIFNIIQNCMDLNPEFRLTIDEVILKLINLLKNKENIFSLLCVLKSNHLKKINKKFILSNIAKYF